MYQPDRKDILINSDWGIPKDRFEKKEAKERNLALFKGRWVSQEEKSILQKQYITYLIIRVIAVSHIIMAGIGVLSGFFVPLEITSLIILFVFAAVSLISAAGLWKFKQLARWLSTLFWAVLGLMFLGYSTPTAIVAIYFLNNKTAKQIFSRQ